MTTNLKISSNQNDSYKSFVALTTSKGLKDADVFLLSGEKLIREFLQKPNLKITHEIIRPGLSALTPSSTIQHIEFTVELFNAIDVLGTHFNILVVEQPQITMLDETALDSYAPYGIEVMMPIGDPGNLGALIRSCEAFGVARVILTREAAHPFLPKTVKASAGSILRIPLARTEKFTDLPTTFRDKVYALDMNGTPINDFVWPANAVLVVGEEGPGFGDMTFKNRITIPTRTVESLNVVVAASIALSCIPQK